MIVAYRYRHESVELEELVYCVVERNISRTDRLDTECRSGSLNRVL